MCPTLLNARLKVLTLLELTSIFSHDVTDQDIDGYSDSTIAKVLTDPSPMYFDTSDFALSLPVAPVWFSCERLTTSSINSSNLNSHFCCFLGGSFVVLSLEDVNFASISDISNSMSVVISFLPSSGRNDSNLNLGSKKVASHVENFKLSFTISVIKTAQYTLS